MVIFSLFDGDRMLNTMVFILWGYLTYRITPNSGAGRRDMGVGGAANRCLFNVNRLYLTLDILWLSRVTDACQMLNVSSPDKSTGFVIMFAVGS